MHYLVAENKVNKKTDFNLADVDFQNCILICHGEQVGYLYEIASHPGKEVYLRFSLNKPEFLKNGRTLYAISNRKLYGKELYNSFHLSSNTYTLPIKL